MSDLSSLSDLSEEERLNVERRIIDRKDPFEMYDDHHFKERFRFSKETAMEMLHIFGNLIQPITKRNQSIDGRTQLLICLRFYATGGFQQLIGDAITVHKSTVCRIIRKVTHHIALLKNEYIKMPASEEERNRLKVGFYRIRNFPGVIGAIDCTHIKITCPGGPNTEMFRNRKGYFSINVQVVCDSNLKIMNIIARWPGSVHDSTIFNDSALCAEFEEGIYGNDCILGDSGYPCRNYLLTPLLNPTTRSEEAYNRSHISTRNTIERCFGVLKRRFPCLSLGMRTSLRTTLASIVAYAVLHNISVEVGDMVPADPGDILQQEIEVNLPVPDVHEGNINTLVRRTLLATVFAR